MKIVAMVVKDGDIYVVEENGALYQATFNGDRGWVLVIESTED